MRCIVPGGDLGFGWSCVCVCPRSRCKMFWVRAPPSRVLLLLRRRVVVVARSLSPRSTIAAHSTRPPVPRCTVESQGLQSAHRCMERELSDEHGVHVRGTCPSIPHVAALGSPCRRRRPFPLPSLRHRCSLHTAIRPLLQCRMLADSISPSVDGT